MSDTEKPRGDIYLVRHGETAWSAAKKHTGRTDIPLTPEGEKRAQALGRFLAGRRFARVLSSPLRRALDTCRLAGYAAEAELTDDLMEWDYGVHEGRTTADIRKETPGWSIWTHSAPGGEQIEQVADRARRVIAKTDSNTGDVAIFAHAHVLRVLAACWLSQPPDAGRLFTLGTASLSILGHERETRVIVKWNQECAAG